METQRTQSSQKDLAKAKQSWKTNTSFQNGIQTYPSHDSMGSSNPNFEHLPKGYAHNELSPPPAVCGQRSRIHAFKGNVQHQGHICMFLLLCSI